MPKLYEYKGIKFFFFSDEHLPVHIHIKYQNFLLKAEFIIENTQIKEIIYKTETAKFPDNIFKAVQEFIEIYKCQIVQKWIEYFIFGIKIKPEIINKLSKNVDKQCNILKGLSNKS